MMTLSMTYIILKDKIKLHQMWLNNQEGGIKANLEEAYLVGANLEEAYLVGADLRGANLRGANLIGANLEEAYLVGANLEEAYLVGADLEGANLVVAKNYYSFVAYDTSKRLVHCVKNETTWMVKAGCFLGYFR